MARATQCLSLDRYSIIRSKYLAEGDRRPQAGGRLLDFHYLLWLVSPLQAQMLPNTCTIHKMLWFQWFFSVNCPPNHKIWVRSGYSIYSLWNLTQLLLQYTVPGSSQVMLLQFITINCFILEQTILMRQSGFKLIQKHHNWKVSSLFVLFLLTRFYDMTRLQIALFMINWQLCKLYMLKAICCTSCSGEKS